MEDVITDIPPPSRFFPDDLDNFASPSPPLPPPFFIFSCQNPEPPRPSTLIIAASPPSRLLVHRLSPKTLIGALFLPELPLAGSSLEAPPRDAGCSVYAAGGDAVILVSFQYPVAAERARAVAKRLVGDLPPGRVLVLDSVRSGGFRGRLSADEALGFKLETSEQRAAGPGPALRSVPYYPTGSVADGLGAAVLAECQLRKLPGTLCLTWPDAGSPPAVSLLETVLRDFLPPALDLQSVTGATVTSVDSDLYV